MTFQFVSVFIYHAILFRSPADLFLELGAEQQIGEEENVSQLPRSFHQLHHEAVFQQLTILKA